MSAKTYFKSDGFKKTNEYAQVMGWEDGANGYFYNCGSMLKEGGVAAPLKLRSEMVMQLSDNAGWIIYYLVV